MHSSMNSNHGYQSLPLAIFQASNVWGYLSGTHSPCLSWQHLSSQQVTAWQFISSSNHMNLSKCMLVSSVWTQVADATLKQVHIINKAAWYCLVQCIPLRRLTGRVRQGGGRLMIHTILFYSGAKFSCHTSLRNLCNVVQIVLQHLAWSVPKHSVAVWICFVWFDRRVVGRKPCQTPNLFQAFLCTAWCHAQQQKTNLSFATEIA